MIWIYIILLGCVFVYLLTIDFKPSHIEFVVILTILLFILANLVKVKELFELDTDEFPERLKLFDIPTYASKRIGEQMDKLIKDAVPKQEDNKTTDEVFSKDNVNEDPDLLDKDQKVDEQKFAMFRREYKLVDAMLLKIREENPDVYARIFGSQ